MALPDPITRKETFLNAAAQGGGNLPEPVTRAEMYLNKAATGSGDIPDEPITREEMYLEALAQGGGGGGGGGVLELVTFTGEDDTSSCDKTFSEIDAMAVPIGTFNGGLFLLQKVGTPSGYKYVGYALVEASDEGISCARCQVSEARVVVDVYTLVAP